MPIDASTVADLGLDKCLAASVNGRVNGVHNRPEWEIAYNPCALAYPAADVASGQITKFERWSDSQIYAGTERDIWAYLPASPSDAYRVVIFNDGAWYFGRTGPVRATQVLDVLHHNREIEPTVAIFLNPGNPDHAVPSPIESYDDRASQRSLEYDRLSPDYGQFIFHEVMPLVANKLEIKFSDNPTHRTTCGISAFMAAWHHPQQCRRVISHCGSFTDIWGGHNVPSLIRHNPAKPIRVFLQSGKHDANTPFGDWALANKTVASALEWAGYDFRFEFGTGGHNLDHAGAIFDETLRWLWRD